MDGLNVSLINFNQYFQKNIFNLHMLTGNVWIRRNERRKRRDRSSWTSCKYNLKLFVFNCSNLTILFLREQNQESQESQVKMVWM